MLGAHARFAAVSQHQKGSLAGLRARARVAEGFLVHQAGVAINCLHGASILVASEQRAVMLEDEVLDAQRVLRTVSLDFLNAQFDRQAAQIDLDELRAIQLGKQEAQETIETNLQERELLLKNKELEWGQLIQELEQFLHKTFDNNFKPKPKLPRRNRVRELCGERVAVRAVPAFHSSCA